jgi:hypothetical protein
MAKFQLDEAKKKAQEARDRGDMQKDLAIHNAAVAKADAEWKRLLEVAREARAQAKHVWAGSAEERAKESAEQKKIFTPLRNLSIYAKDIGMNTQQVKDRAAGLKHVLNMSVGDYDAFMIGAQTSP